MNEPRLIEGGLRIDDRGQVAFVNDFDFPGIKRFYTVANHRAEFVRAWHAHKYESKYVTALSGTALVGVAKIDNWEAPAKDLYVHRFVISAAMPAILCIPDGFAHGYMTLTSDTKLMFFSTATLEESTNDDFRYDARYWDIWNVVER